ncbi:peptidase S24-like family protein, partial [Chlamydia psittaci 08-2626_L3]
SSHFQLRYQVFWIHSREETLY